MQKSFNQTKFPQTRRTPSFSSTLLDSINHSIDREEMGFYRESSINGGIKNKGNLSSSLQRAIMIENWMEKQNPSWVFNSSSSSSNSSSGGPTFSSSETEHHRSYEKKQQNSKNESGFSKTKLKALKIYGELKKVKQPISPGGRITSFLNSIFSSGNGKKVKMCSVGTVEDVSFDRKLHSAGASASSFSRRSCLSKSPALREKQSNGMKRSVRFFPVSIIVDEDSRPCGHKSIYEMDETHHRKEVKKLETKNNKGVTGDESPARAFYRSCRKNEIIEFESMKFGEIDEDDDDDGESYASSDLFELDHLIGIGKFREELPVYETTDFKRNIAIANGLIL